MTRILPSLQASENEIEEGDHELLELIGFDFEVFKEDGQKKRRKSRW
jgi:hypothetical protein